MKIWIGMKMIAVECGCSQRTLRRWIRQENFPAFKKDGVYRAIEDDVVVWLRNQYSDLLNENMPGKGNRNHA